MASYCLTISKKPRKFNNQHNNFLDHLKIKCLLHFTSGECLNLVNLMLVSAYTERCGHVVIRTSLAMKAGILFSHSIFNKR